MRGTETKKKLGTRSSKEQAHYLAQIYSHQRREDLGNTRCAECDDLGTTYICMTFGVFVCAGCAGLHRELSHRVKGIATSFWTPEEIDFILAHTNAKVNGHFLRRYEPSDRPRPKSGDVQSLRQWLKEKYSEERWADKGETGRSDTASRRASATRGSQRSYTAEPDTGGISADRRPTRQIAASQPSQFLTGDDDFLEVFQMTKTPLADRRQTTHLVHGTLSPKRKVWLKTDQDFCLSGEDDNAFDCNPFQPHVTSTAEIPPTQNEGAPVAGGSPWTDRVQNQEFSFIPEVSYLAAAGRTPHRETQTFSCGVDLHTIDTPQVSSLTTPASAHAFSAIVPESGAKHSKGTLRHSSLMSTPTSLSNTINPLSTCMPGTSGVWNPPFHDPFNGTITPAIQLTTSNQEVLFSGNFNHQTATESAGSASVLSTTVIPPKKDGVKEKDAFESLGTFGWPGPPSSLHSR